MRSRMMTSRSPEPKVRKDGTCHVCRKPIETRPRPGVPPLLYVDPFCSSVCARAYYDVKVELLSAGRRRVYQSEEPPV